MRHPDDMLPEDIKGYDWEREAYLEEQADLRYGEEDDDVYR